jgi:hypothetical protein
VTVLEALQGSDPHLAFWQCNLKKGLRGSRLGPQGWLRCCEIRLRAERKAGRLLNQMEKAKSPG